MKKKSELAAFYKQGVVEAGCDEAGRGCLAGPVYAAAVILPTDYHNALLNDSKQLTERRRYQLREVIEREAVAWAVGVVDNREIDEINILRASILAMHRALDQLTPCPEHIIVDGNRWHPWRPAQKDGTEAVEAHTVVKGDAKYLSIAAASILAKTYRDDCMLRLDRDYPQYCWSNNKGYPTAAHREAIRLYGVTPHHRLSFNLLGEEQQMEFDFGVGE